MLFDGTFSMSFTKIERKQEEKEKYQSDSHPS